MIKSISLFLACFAFCGIAGSDYPVARSESLMPYRRVGLSERQAAAHLLDRFSWGATPESIDEVTRVGLDTWFEQQLKASEADDEVRQRTSTFKTLGMSTAEIAAMYPPPGKILIELMRQGTYRNIADIQDSSNKTARRAALKYAYENGYRPQKELLGQLFAQKLLRAVYSKNQLLDVVSDFWFNHFCVSALKTPARNYIPTYERDAIRAHALGSFQELLMATAKHPAMLQYLDNAQSTAPEGCPTLLSTYLDSMKSIGGIRGWVIRRKLASMESKADRVKSDMMRGIPDEFKPRRGINENYARELLELHTLGVDGGYTQRDVSELARALTGWSMLPLGLTKNHDKVMEMIEKTQKAGTVVEGDFLFRADAHDVRSKIVLGRKYVAGLGLDEGEEILRVLSQHPSTATHIATKLCRRFVSDNPSKNIIDRVSAVFLRSHGDVKQMLRYIVQSEEFWDSSARYSKIKTPFELCVSAMRVLHADVHATKDIYDWITRLGQQMYAAPAPTGFGDKADNWVNAGSLLNRMNFGLAIASQSLQGVRTNVTALSPHHEPESAESAFHQYFALLLPERSDEASLRLLRPMLSNPQIADSIQQKGSRLKMKANLIGDDDIMSDDDVQSMLGHDTTPNASPSTFTSQSLSRIVGIILGSPEFQRR